MDAGRLSRSEWIAVAGGVLLLAALAPLILAWIVIRDHELSWPRGELTAVVAMAAIGLVLYSGIVSRPGEPRAAIGPQFGWFAALAGLGMMLVGGAKRAAEVERRRKPPGVL